MEKINQLITVIVPIYNTGQYLAECIESVINQTYQDLQILLVDDGSTDNSFEICKNYAGQDSRIQVFHQPHEGVSNARNFGLNHAKGGFVAFIDSDDTVLPGYIKNMYEAIAQSDAALAKTLWMINGKISGNSEIMKFEGTKVLNIKQLSSSEMLSCIGGTMHRRSDIGELRFDQEVRFGEDTLFNTKVLYHSKSQNVVFLKTAEYIYRIRNDSASHTADYHIYQSAIKAWNELLLMTKGMGMEFRYASCYK